jgi:hypothetical protein
MIDRQIIIRAALLSLNIIKDLCLVVLEYTTPCPKLDKQGRKYKYFLKVSIPFSPIMKAYIQCIHCGVTNNNFIRDCNYFTSRDYNLVVIKCWFCTTTIMKLEEYKKLLIKNELPKPIKWDCYTRKGTKRLPNN